MKAFATCVFTAQARDNAEEIAQSINNLGGAGLLRELHPRLLPMGWRFGESYAEDFGWQSEAVIGVGGKDAVVTLAAAPEDVMTPDGRASNDRWRLVLSMELGLLPGTKAARRPVFAKFTRDVDTVAKAINQNPVEWDEDGPT